LGLIALHDSLLQFGFNYWDRLTEYQWFYSNISINLAHLGLIQLFD